MAELNKAGCTIMPYQIKDEEIIGMSTMQEGSLLNTDYVNLFDKQNIQSALESTLKTKYWKLTKFDLVINKPSVDKRRWGLANNYSEIMDYDAGAKSATVIIALDDLFENSGAMLWVPYSYKLHTFPAIQKLSKPFFEDPVSGKIYDMKKRFAVMRVGDVCVMNGLLWRSVGLNTTEEPTRMLIATFEAEETEE